MAQCKHCGRTAVLLRATSQGLCKRCREEVRAKAEAERERVKEALIFARCLKDPHDKALHLRRAMDSVRTLSRYERLGYPKMQPSPKALASLLEEKLEEVNAELRPNAVADSPASAAFTEQTSGEMLEGSELSVGPAYGDDARRSGRASPPGPAEERGTRRVRRRQAVFPVEVERGIRGRTENVSSQGLRICSPLFRRPGTRVSLTLYAPQGLVTTEGVVRWAREVTQEETGQTQAVMGLEFSTPPPALRMYG